MFKHAKTRLWFVISACFILLLPFSPTPVAARSPGSQDHHVPSNIARSYKEGLKTLNPLHTPSANTGANLAAPLQQTSPTTLTVSIISSPYAELDANDPDGPQTFVVEAVITNTGTTTATDVILSLDYNPDPSNDWVLLNGEDPDRTLAELASGDTYYGYWFASYPYTDSLTHQYTVTIKAANASPTSTSYNYYNPAHGATVQTRQDGQETGSTDIGQVDVDIVVGIAFTFTVGYGWNPGTQGAIASNPIGNINFDAGSYRLISCTTRLSDDRTGGGTQIGDDIQGHLYLPIDDDNIQYAETTYKFIAVRATETTLCPYTMVMYGDPDSPNTIKYHNTYCSPQDQTTIPFTSTNSISLTKHVSDLTIQQGQLLTYTMHITNNSDIATSDLTYAWFWDNIPPAAGSILTSSITPTSDLVETNATRVAWYSPTVSPNYTDTYTFTIRTDDAQDLADGAQLVNHAFYGINEGSLPQEAALASTVTTTVRAPTISINKTDGVTATEPNSTLTYTLRITNSGSITATQVIITDTLPTNVNYTPGTASLPETDRVGQTLVWDNLGPILPNGGNIVIEIPVTVASTVPNGTTLNNIALVKYENTIGYVFSTQVATDTTTIDYEPSFVDVYTFIDADGDGVRDAGEGPLSGVVITMARGAPSVTTTTGISQSYHFEIAEAGPISVTTSLPGGYFRTTPGMVFLRSSFGTTQTVGFGFAPNTSAFGVIYGTVFEDANVDGIYDTGDAGLSSVTVTLDASNIATTDINGHYAFSTTSATTHTVVETDPPNHFSTTPNSVDVSVSLLNNGYQVDFGDATPGLSLIKTAQDLNDAPLYAGDLIRYVITVTNESATVTMTNVIVTDTLPNGVEFVSTDTMTDTGPNPLVWSAGDLGPGESWIAAVIVRVDGTQDPIGSNVAAVSSDQQGTQQTDPPVLPPGGGGVNAGLTLTKTAEDLNGSPLYTSDLIRYVITVTNESATVTMTNVIVTDTLPNGVEFVSTDTMTNTGPNPLVWSAGDLGPGESWIAAVIVRVDGTQDPIGSNVAAVSSDQQGTQQTDPPVLPPGGGGVNAGLTLTKTAEDLNGSPLYTGDLIRYVITVTNKNTSTTMTNVVVTDALPAGVIFVSATPGDYTGPDPLGWNIATVDPNATWTAVITVQVDGSANPISENVAAVRSDQQNEQETNPVLPPGGGNVNGTAGANVTPTTVDVEEGGATETYSVTLHSEPTDIVTITIITDGQTFVSPSSLSFDATNWDTVQQVTVTAVDDDDVEGTHISTINHSVTSNDLNYDGVTITNVTANVSDNDAAPAPVSVQFNSATYSVKETAGLATITVILNGTATMPVTVTYATNGGTATAGSDYTAVSATLRFDVGQTHRTFAVPVFGDTIPESDETVSLTLSAPVNATLGTPNTATLTIKNNALYLPLVIKNHG